MRVGLNLGLTRWSGGTSDAYANAIAAYDLSRAGSYTLDTGRVSVLTDFSPNGRNLTQAVAADRPTIGTMTDGKTALVHTNAEEWLYSDDSTLGTLFNVGASCDFTVTIVHELSVNTTNQSLVQWTVPGTNTDEGGIWTDSVGRLRIYREILTSTADTINSSAVYSTGTTYVTTVTFSGGLVNAWVNGSQILTNVAFATNAGTLAATRFAIGARDQTTDTNGVEGYIHSVVIEAN